MRIAAIYTAFIFILSAVTSADAHSHKHNITLHHRQYVHSMVQGLGIGLIYMLRSSQESHQSGPSTMPVYRYEQDTRHGTGYPHLVDVPPKGWPLRPPLKHQERVPAPDYKHVAYAGGHGLDQACRSAARQGGPCGCWAQEYFFSSPARLLNGVNLWLARTWREVFPRVEASAGTAAVWPGGRHVAPVVAVNGDGTITVHDSWADHRVSMRGLVFVDPHGGQGRFRSAYSM